MDTSKSAMKYVEKNTNGRKDKIKKKIKNNKTWNGIKRIIVIKRNV
jgi:hypothetical protein